MQLSILLAHFLSLLTVTCQLSTVNFKNYVTKNTNSLLAYYRGLNGRNIVLPLAMLQAGDQFYSFDATGVKARSLLNRNSFIRRGDFCFDGSDLHSGVVHHLLIQEKNPADSSVRI